MLILNLTLSKVSYVYIKVNKFQNSRIDLHLENNRGNHAC